MDSLQYKYLIATIFFCTGTSINWDQALNRAIYIQGLISNESGVAFKRATEERSNEQKRTTKE